MAKIRVLVVDDAVVVRVLVSKELDKDPDIEVVGTASNGKIALEKIEQLKPDIMTLDIEMPVMDGLQTLEALRKTNKTLPVIMFSTLSEHGAAVTMEALAKGANDYATKPSNVGKVMEAIQCLREELIPKIKAHCPGQRERARQTTIISRASTRLEAVKAPRATAGIAVRPEIMVLGISTGGPNALAELMPRFPADFPVPILIVQHMPPVFTRLLAERLSVTSKLNVREGAEGMILKPGDAAIAPGDFHMTLKRHAGSVVVHLNQGAPENSCRPAADVLFRSAAQEYGKKTLAVIMTGMGQDGLKGCQEISKAGGRIVIQDAASSVVWGMPGAVADADLADEILPLSKLADGIMKQFNGATSLNSSMR